MRIKVYWSSSKLWLLLVGVILITFPFIAATNSASTTSTTSNKQKTSVYDDISMELEIPYQNFTSSLQAWDNDYAVMFYAPWCKYCKQLYQSWEAIAKLTMKPSSSVIVGTFNCELNTRNTELCQQFGVDRYPSLYFIGYGNYYQSHPSKAFKTFSKSTKGRIARYNADIYPEAIYDWVVMLSTISASQRKWDDVKGAFSSLFFGKSSNGVQVRKLSERIHQLENKVDLYSQALEKYKADELFDSLEDNGDPYPLLASMEPDQYNLPFRACVAEMVSEYCKYHKSEESHCRVTDTCLAQNMEPKECRPEKCPFDSQRGCIVASLCLDKSIIKQYQQELAA